jgi:hypothetical protein
VDPVGWVGSSLSVNGIDSSELEEDGKDEIEGGAEPGEDENEETEGGAEPGEDEKEEIEGGERDDISPGLLGSIAYMPIVALPDITVDRSC